MRDQAAVNGGFQLGASLVVHDLILYLTSYPR
jgi:hypothetical protein